MLLNVFFWVVFPPVNIVNNDQKSLRKINVDVSHIKMTTIHLAIMNKNQTTSQTTNNTPSIQSDTYIIINNKLQSVYKLI